MTLKKITNKLLILSIIIVIFGVGYRSGQYSAQTSPRGTTFDYTVSNADQDVTNIDFSLFWETWNALEDNYIDQDKLDPKDLYYGAIKGMVSSLDDQYTFFLTPEENQQSKDDLSGKFTGIGAQLGLENNRIVIIAPLKDSPAEKAGARVGDIIIKVDGESTDNWTLQQAVNTIRGPEGEEVILTMLRKNDEVDVPIIRAEINVPSLEVTYENNIAIMELTRFGDDTNRLWDKEVNNLVQKQKNGNLKGIVLDMRNNPGGFLDGAVHIGSEFVNKGTLIVNQEFLDQPTKEYKANRQGKLVEVPLVILVNGGSASASEIVAGALRDHGKATLVGEQTFGKGTVQQALDLTGGAGIHVTIARWVLPKGDWINDKGITPDIIETNTVEDGQTLTRETDIQLDKAIEILLK